MTKQRETVELRRYQDGKFTDLRIERRLVYTDKTGAQYVRGAMGKSPVHRDATTGMLYWEIRFFTGTTYDIADVLRRMHAVVMQGKNGAGNDST